MVIAFTAVMMFWMNAAESSLWASACWTSFVTSWRKSGWDGEDDWMRWRISGRMEPGKRWSSHIRLLRQEPMIRILGDTGSRSSHTSE